MSNWFAFPAFYRRAIEVSRFLPFDSSSTLGEDDQTGFYYRRKIDELRTKIETLPEFKNFEKELLVSRVLSGGTWTGSGFKGGGEEGSSLGEILQKLGVYQDLLDGRPQDEILKVLESALAQPLGTSFIWLQLEGITLPHGLCLETPSGGRFGQFGQFRRLFQTRERREFERRYPNSLEIQFRVKGDEEWGLLLPGFEVEDSAVWHELNEGSYPDYLTREAIINDFWRDLLAIALCDSGFFNVSSVSESSGDLGARDTDLEHFGTRGSPFDYYSYPGGEGFSIAPKEKEAFERFFDEVATAIRSVSQLDDEGLKECSQLYLHSRLQEHPRLFDPDFGNEGRDVFLRYVVCIEKLVCIAGEGDKKLNFTKRAPRLASKTQEERKEFEAALRRIYEVRGEIVHSTLKTELESREFVEDLRKLRKVARRALACSYLLLSEVKSDRHELMASLDNESVIRARAKQTSSRIP